MWVSEGGVLVRLSQQVLGREGLTIEHVHPFPIQHRIPLIRQVRVGAQKLDHIHHHRVGHVPLLARIQLVLRRPNVDLVNDVRSLNRMQHHLEVRRLCARIKAIIHRHRASLQRIPRSQDRVGLVVVEDRERIRLDELELPPVGSDAVRSHDLSDLRR